MKTGLWDRITVQGDSAVVGPGATPVADVLDRLEAQESAGELVIQLGLEPLDLVAVVGIDALDNRLAGPSLVQGPPRKPKLKTALMESGVPALFTACSRAERLAMAAGLLQIHDFWDESHRAAQQADDLGESKVSAYWHGITHRREPDAGNASYWFRRIGRHPVFMPLAEEAIEMLGDRNVDRALASRLIPNDHWDPIAFIQICTHDPSLTSLAREIQRAEMRLLLAASVPS